LIDFQRKVQEIEKIEIFDRKEL